MKEWYILGKLQISVNECGADLNHGATERLTSGTLGDVSQV